MERPLKRVGAIGDVHAEDGLLATAAQFLDSCGLDLVVCVGDIADGKGDVNRCCDLLRQRQFPTVRGNHDRWLLEGTNRAVEDASLPEHVRPDSWRYLASLPTTLEYPTAGGELLVCHGLGEHDLASVQPKDSAEEIYHNLELWALYRCANLRLVINGHTHRRELRRFHHLTVIGVGTLHRAEAPCCAIIDIPGQTVEFYDLGSGGKVELATRTAWPNVG
jgi:predicted phosphodiesterase